MRSLRERLSGQRARLSNWRNRRTIARGRRPRTTQAPGAVCSRLPVYRNRVNPATGRPHRDDRRTGRTTGRSLARTAPLRRADVPHSRGQAQALALLPDLRDALIAGRGRQLLLADRRARSTRGGSW